MLKLSTALQVKSEEGLIIERIQSIYHFLLPRFTSAITKAFAVSKSYWLFCYRFQLYSIMILSVIPILNLIRLVLYSKQYHHLISRFRTISSYKKYQSFIETVIDLEKPNFIWPLFVLETIILTTEVLQPI